MSEGEEKMDKAAAIALAQKEANKSRTERIAWEICEGMWTVCETVPQVTRPLLYIWPE